MDKETYEALKVVVQNAKDHEPNLLIANRIARVEDWIDEVAKEYEEVCDECLRVHTN